MVLGVLFPAQRVLVPGLDGYSSLLFLPHGVRVLTAWLLGWRSVFALAPGAALAHAWLLGDGAFEWPLVGVFLLGITVAPLTFTILRSIGWKSASSEHDPVCWRTVLAAGAIASIPNTLVANTLFNAPSQDYVAYFVGDFFGLLTLMVIMILGLRAWRMTL